MKNIIRDLILIRHAHSEWQAGITNDRNSHLTKIGIYQAKKLFNILQTYTNIKDFHIISSPLHRAVETGKIALPHHLFLKVIFDNDFQEAPFHVRKELRLTKYFFQKKNLTSDKYLFFKKKIKNSLYKILSQYNRIIIFTHGGVIKTILRIHCGSDCFCTQIDNCSITHFTYKKKFWVIQKVNQKF